MVTVSRQGTSREQRVDRRVKRTRRIVEEAFQDLLREKKFRDITVQDIADRADVNRATFYAHFQDKYDLLDQLLRERFRKEVIGKMPEDESERQKLRWFVVATLEELAALVNQQCHDIGVEPIVETRLQQEIREFLPGCFNQSAEDKTKRRPEIAASVLSWAIFGAGMDWSRMPADSRPLVEEMADEILALLPSEF